MKKKLFSIILASILVISLVGCNNSTNSTSSAKSAKPEDAVEVFLKNTENLDFDEMSKDINPDSKDTLDELKDMESDDTSLMEYFRKNAPKMTYEIKDSKVDGDNATVTVDFEYIDGTYAFEDASSKLVEEVLNQAEDEKEMTDDETQTFFSDAVNNYESEDIFTKKTIEIDCIKKGDKWYVKDINDDLYNVITCNYQSYFDSIE